LPVCGFCSHHNGKGYIEHEQFDNGFEDSVKQISSIEESVGLADIAQFTLRNHHRRDRVGHEITAKNPDYERSAIHTPDPSGCGSSVSLRRHSEVSLSQ